MDEDNSKKSTSQDSNDKEKIVFKANNIILSQLKDKYFKNKEPLKNKDDSPYDETKFTQLVKENTNRFINQKFENIVVLFGLGASVTDNKISEDINTGILTSGVTVEMLANIILDKLKSEKYCLNGNMGAVFALDELSKITMYGNENDYEILDHNVLKSDFNLEDFLSNLFVFENFISQDKREVFLNTKGSILDIIKKATSYDYDEHKFNHVKLLNILSKINKSGSKLNFVTTNYANVASN